MFVGIVFQQADLVEFAVFVQHAQTIPGGEQAHAGTGDVFFGDQAFLIGFHHVQVGVAAVHIAAVLDGHGSGFGCGIGDHVTGVEVPHGPAVADHMAFKAPFFAEDVQKQCLATAAGFAIGAVIGAHDGFHVGFLHQRFESGQVGFPHVFFVGNGIKFVTDGFGAGMHGIVLGAGSQLQVFTVALQALDERHAQTTGEVGIFAVGFMAAAPAGITEDVDVGGPVGQALIDVPVAVGGVGIVLGAAFVGDDLGNFVQRFIVEHGGHADGLREHGGGTGTGYAVEAFVPPIVGRNAQPFNGGSVIAQLAGFFFQGHFGNQFGRQRTGFLMIHHGFPLLFSLFSMISRKFSDIFHRESG